MAGLVGVLAVWVLSAVLSSTTLPTARAQTALVVGGEFRQAGGVEGLQNVAQWNGNRWSRLAGPPLGEGIVWSLAVYNGALVAAGRYNLAGPAFVNNIAQFDGFKWSPLGLGLELINIQGDVDVQAMLVFKDLLIAAGYFDTAGGVRALNIAQWDGVAWAPLGAGVNNEVFSLAVFNNNLIVGGEFFTAGGAQALYVAQWDGAAWSTLGAGITSQGGKVFALTVYNGVLVAGGEFSEAGGVAANNVASWDGTAWAPVGAGVSNPVGPLAPTVNVFAVFRGDLILGGRFQSAGGVQVNRVARWDGTAYGSLGSGLNDEAGVLAVYDGNLIVGGRFDTAGGQPAAQLAQWDGAAWSSLNFLDEFDSYTWFHAFVLVTVATNCTLPGVAWRSQYYTPTNVLVEDQLVFSTNTTFTQTLTAFPYQACGAANTIVWTGTFAQESDVDLALAYGACTPAGTGCLACGSASQLSIQYKFSSDCEVLTVLSPESDDVRTYYANARVLSR